ncbi:MAG: hypothetical protein LBV08_01785 [Clostridiales bacterium]|jgi:capsular polysaccharide biosynthesis protein|nr:hypothetical protein [Clostridiales bacterium]
MEYDEISLKSLFDLLVKNIIVIVLSGIAGLVLALVVTTLVIDKEYESNVKLYVYAPSGLQTSSQDVNALNYAQKIVNTYIQMLDARSFYGQILADTNLSYTEEQLMSMVTFSVLNSTEVFEATVVTTDPEESKLIADSITKIAPQTISALQENANLKIVDPAVLPLDESSPNLYLNLAVGLFFGVALAVAAIILKDMLDSTVKGEEDILTTYNIPLLASIPSFDELMIGE